MIPSWLQKISDWVAGILRKGKPMDFNFVTERIAVGGGIFSADDAQALVAAGITHVVDMTENEDSAPYDSSFTRLWLPQVDDGTPRPAGQYPKGVSFVFAALAMPAPPLKNKVYIHCAAGVNRGPTMCYAVLRAFGINQPLAITMIRTARPQVGFFNQPNYISSVETQLFG